MTKDEALKAYGDLEKVYEAYQMFANEEEVFSTDDYEYEFLRFVKNEIRAAAGMDDDY